MRISKKQLSGFLEILKLRGLDDEVKTRTLVNDVIIQVGDNQLSAFGIDDTTLIPFNHILDVEIEEEQNDPEVIIISDITKWITYIDSLKGDTISIIENDNSTELSHGNEVYQIPLEVDQSIRSYIRTGEEPLIDYDGDFYDVGSRDEWSEFTFNPSVFLKSITSGKHVNNMNISLNIGKNVFGIEIGDINDPATPSYSNKDVQGIDNLTWKFKKNQLLTWNCEVGLHSIIKVMNILDHAEQPSLFFKAPNKNLILRTNNASINGAPIRATWAIGTPMRDDHDYEQDLEDLVSGE